MIDFSPFSKTFLTIGPLEFHYYGLMYAFAFLFGYWFIERIVSAKKLDVSTAQIDRVFFGTIIFGLIGGRLGHVLIYNPEFFLSNIGEIFAVWKGGMASHGGFIGGLIGMYVFRPRNISFFRTLDLLVLPVPIGLMLGRLGNFINGELYGKVTSVSWCMDFGDGLCRHPTQLYAMGKDLFLFIVLFVFFRLNVVPGALAALFLIVYGGLRCIVEFFKESTQGNNYLEWLTTGQVLSLFMIVLGGILLFFVYRREGKLFKEKK